MLRCTNLIWSLLLGLLPLLSGCFDSRPPTETDGTVSIEAWRAYFKQLQASPDGTHLFGHESTTMMGVYGAEDWELKSISTIASQIDSQRSDVRAMTDSLPAVMGYDAFKLILDVTDDSTRLPEVEAHLKGLSLFRKHGGLLAFNWHIQPVKLPGYRERAYRMDEVQNNPYIDQMKEIQPFYRIANGFEDKDEWWMAYEAQRLAPMAQRLSHISQDGSGIVFRPYHEADGDWFWWGLRWLQGPDSLNGKAALMKVFIETARYLKQRLPKLLIAFSTDKLDYISHETGDSLEIARRYKEEFASFLPQDSSDLALIDIYGMDLYINHDHPGRFEDFKLKLMGLTLLAREHDKVMAITEAGNRGIPAEDDSRQPCIYWYTQYLQAWAADPQIDVAFFVIWQNWSNNRHRTEEDPDDGYFVPVYPDSPAGQDFIDYVRQPQSMMLGAFRAHWHQFTHPQSE